MTAPNSSGPPSKRGERLRLARDLAAGLAVLGLVGSLAFLLRMRPLELRPELDITRGIVADEVHRHQVRLGAGEFLRVTATQGGSFDGLDLILVLLDPQGAEIAKADDPNGGIWDEELAWVAAVAGLYHLEVRRADGPKGYYRFQVKALGRPARPEDILRAEGLRLDQAATQLMEKSREVPQQIRLRRQSRAIWGRLGDHRREAEACSLIGSAWFSLGDYDQAVEHFHQAARIWPELANREEQARTLLGLARAERRRERPEAARRAFDRGLALATDPEARMFLLHGRGNLLLDLGSLDLGIRDLRACLDLAQRLGSSWVAANAFHDLGFAYRSLGRWDDAILHFNKAAQTSDKLEMTANNSLGGVYTTLGDWDRAIQHYEKALELTRRLRDFRNQAKILNNLALVHHRNMRLRRALELFHQVLGLEQLDPDTKATVLNNMAFVWLDLGQPRQALDLCDKSRKLDPKAEAGILEAEGIAYLRLGEHGLAQQRLGRALALNEERNDQFRQASVTLVQGQVARAEKDLDAALRYASRAVTIVESFRTGVEDDTLRASFLASKRDPYDFYVDTLVELHQARPGAGFDAESLRVNEMSRARSLLDLLNQAVSPAGRRTAPAPAQPPSQAHPLALAEIQSQVLGPDTLLLEYALGEKQSYLWAVTPASLQVFLLPSKGEIEKTARAFYDQLRVRAGRERDDPAIEPADAQATHLAAELSRTILEPVERAGLLRKESTILVVSDGALQYIPFSALPLPSSLVAGQPKPPVRMVEEHEIVHLPSASVLASLREELDNRPAPAHTLALFADPVFSLDDSRVRPAGFLDKLLKPRRPARRGEEADQKYPRLLWSEEEADEILKLVDRSEVLERRDFDASVAAVLGAPLDQYRFLHFATHGRIDGSRPERSSLVLSLYNQKGERQEHGHLSLSDVYNLRLNADLVVLSACDTALGKEMRGEGLIGLTRGFMYAGSRRVLASLWSVDDEVTSQLMRRLYKGMLKEEKMSPAAALRQAQRDMLRHPKWNAPYYWAGFSLQGEWR